MTCPAGSLVSDIEHKKFSYFQEAGYLIVVVLGD